jgi:hypothetical protein
MFIKENKYLQRLFNIIDWLDMEKLEYKQIDKNTFEIIGMKENGEIRKCYIDKKLKWKNVN